MTIPRSSALGDVQETDAALPPPAQAKSGRLYYVDNLRTVVIVLVVLVHVAIIYGGLGSETVETSQAGPLVTLLLAWFAFVNQAFLMGLLFFIAGYFIPGSFNRRGTAPFVKQRLLRLGIPLLIYDLLINPPILYLQMTETAGGQPALAELLRNYASYVTGIGSGPMWFIWNLLLFSLAYALWRALRSSVPTKTEAAVSAPGNKALLLFVLLLAAGAFLVRLAFPLGWESFVNLRLQYYWQYPTCFVLGLIAWQRQWLTAWPQAVGRRWLLIGIVTCLFFPAVPLLGDPRTIRGGFYWQTFVFAAWEALLAVGLGLGLLLLFRQRYNRQGAFGRVLSANAYAVYLIHVPIIFLLQLGLQSVAVPVSLKFILVSVIGVALCFLVSHFFARRLPLLRTIL